MASLFWQRWTPSLMFACGYFVRLVMGKAHSSTYLEEEQRILIHLNDSDPSPEWSAIQKPYTTMSHLIPLCY
jgi:hypothetical protein